MPNGPVREKLEGPRCATVGTVSSRTISVPGTAPARSAYAAMHPTITTMVKAAMETKARSSRADGADYELQMMDWGSV